MTTTSIPVTNLNFGNLVQTVNGLNGLNSNYGSQSAAGISFGDLGRLHQLNEPAAFKDNQHLLPDKFVWAQFLVTWWETDKPRVF